MIEFHLQSQYIYEWMILNQIAIMSLLSDTEVPSISEQIVKLSWCGVGGDMCKQVTDLGRLVISNFWSLPCVF